jgi:transposase-like protein
LPWGTGENRRTIYRISEAARELGISAELLRVGREEVSSLPLLATAIAPLLYR